MKLRRLGGGRAEALSFVTVVGVRVVEVVCGTGRGRQPQMGRWIADRQGLIGLLFSSCRERQSMTPPVGTRHKTGAWVDDGGGGLSGRWWMGWPRAAITGRNRLSWGSDPESGLEHTGCGTRMRQGGHTASLQFGGQMVRKRPPKVVHWRIEDGMRERRDRRNI